MAFQDITTLLVQTHLQHLPVQTWSTNDNVCSTKRDAGPKRTCEGLPLIVVQQPSERLGDDTARGREASCSHVGGLQQHGSNEVHALQQLQVDVHVEGHLPSPLQLLLLRRLVLVSATWHHTCHSLVSSSGLMCM